MFNVGPFELLVLAAVALLLFGPDRLPQLTKDAVRMLRTLRDIAQGARSELTSGLGPEFANFDLRSLDPKKALRDAIMGDDDLDSIDPRELLARALRGEDEAASPPPAGTTHPANLNAEARSPLAPPPPAPGGVPLWDPDAT